MTLKALVKAPPGWLWVTVFRVAVTPDEPRVSDWAAAVVEVKVKALVTVKLVLAVRVAEAASVRALKVVANEPPKVLVVPLKVVVKAPA